MRGQIENINEKITFSYADGEYELRSHPYEPCLYIFKDDEMIKILHNAFDVYDLPSIFEAGETVRAINGKDFDEETFCSVLIAAINDTHYEMDWPFAAELVKNETV
ncbi:MAG: hypothetical protein MJ171_05930 [Clostridia bacterium]|nr:hypothetical protein [Clostridia bacterium]